MFLPLLKFAMRGAKPGLMALLLAAAAPAAAQDYRPATGDVFGQQPGFQTALGTSALRESAREREMDLLAIDAYVGKRRAIGSRAAERPGTWMLYGRLGPMNFTNQFDFTSGGTQVTLRGNSHGLTGKIYIGIHRRF